MLEESNTLATIAKVAGIASAAVAVLTAIMTRTVPWLWVKFTSHAVSNRIGAELYPPAHLARSIRNYVRPDFQDLDPAGGDEPRMVYGARQPLFEALDDAFSRRTEYRYLILLADSGMGKTSALLNYYARHLRKLRRPYKLTLLPLNIPDVDDRINAIENKTNTVLLLDALDEDTLAIVDHRERVKLLVELTRDFYKVLISCRTQFFGKDEEIPTRTGVIVVGSRAAGESAEHRFHKLYLSPFSEQQVNRYICKLYPPWSARRARARELVAKVPSLSARPMLLAHFDELVSAGRTIHHSFELYDEMVNAWIRREDGFINNPAELRRFSELIAVDLFTHRQVRGAERIPIDELTVLTNRWNIAIDQWNLSGRSLLNRDAEGNFKFAHRSIMEYLYVKRALAGDQDCREVVWTDQMQDFLREMILATNFTLKGFRESGPSIQEVLKWLDLGSAEENHENAVSFFPSDEEDLKTAASFFRWLFHLPRTYETVVTIDTDNAEGSVTLVLNLLDEHSAPNRPQLDHHKKEFQLVLPTGAGPFDSGGASLVGKAFRDASIGDVFIFASGKRYWLFAVPESGDRVDDVKGVLAEILLWAANLPGRCRWEDLSVPAVAYYEMRTLRDR